MSRAETDEDSRRKPGAEWSYVQRPERLRRHTRVRLLRTDDPAFPAMLEAIRGARSIIHFEMYIFRDDALGRQFRDALVERARNGVAVRVLLDGLGSFGLPSAFVDTLRSAGVRVIIFHPFAPWRPRWGWNRRDHKKILVVDDMIGFTGGLNIGMEYVPVDQGGGGWLDWHARVEGSAVHDLAAVFRTTWIKSGGDKFPRPAPPRPALGSNALGVQVISNVNLRWRWRMVAAYLHAIARAEQSISIMNSYFIPERRLRRAFRQAVRRGVSVRVIVPSKSDVVVVEYASRHLYERLLLSGVRIFEWPERMMHAKIGVIDDVWTTVGSYNLDRRSLVHNLEVGLVMIDGRIGRDLRADFEREVVRCREVTLEDCRSRSRFEKARDWFFFQLRAWL